MLKSSASASKKASRSGARSSGESPLDHPPPRLPHPLDARGGRLEPLARVGDRLPVVAAHEVHQQRVAPDLVEDRAEPADVPYRLGHLVVAELQHPVVHPEARQRAPAGGQRLRRLVLVVREQQVAAAAVDVELDPQQLLGHRRALDVPARPSHPPRRGPGLVLVLLLALPEREVERILLARGALDALALVHLVDRAVGELAVLGQRAHAEVDVAVDGVGVPALDEVGDQRHDRLDVLRRQRLVVGPAEAEALGVVLVVRGHLGGQRLRADPGLARRRVDLVVDVRDVGHQRGLEALVLEEALEQREDDERAGVADVDARVDRRPAGVDADATGVARLERHDPPGTRVMQGNRPHAAGP